MAADGNSFGGSRRGCMDQTKCPGSQAIHRQIEVGVVEHVEEGGAGDQFQSLMHGERLVDV